MSNYKSYNPGKVKVVLKGIHAVRGYGDDTMVDIGFTSDRNSMFVGVDGHARHVGSLDRTGDIKLVLSMGSASNAFMAALLALDEPFSFLMSDLSSNGDMFAAASCTIKTIPRMVKGKDSKSQEYTLQFTKGKMTMLGAALAD